MENYETEFLLEIADDSIEGYELLTLINHMATYCHGVLTHRQQEVVDEVEDVLNFIYMRDKLEDAKKEKESQGDEDGTHSDD